MFGICPIVNFLLGYQPTQRFFQFELDIICHMKNSQKGSIAVWLMIIVLLLIAGIVYFYKTYATHPASDQLPVQTTQVPNDENKLFGYISSISNMNGSDYLMFKQFEFLQGSTADAAARKAGTCISDNDGCHAANGYFIQGTDIATATIEVSPNAGIIMATDCAAYPQISPPNMSVSFDTFKTFFRSGTVCSYKDSPYWIQTDNSSKVVQIKEQYLP